MNIFIPFRHLLLMKLILILSLLGILIPFPRLLVAQPLFESRGTNPFPLTLKADREIRRDTNGHWHLIYKKRQEPKNGIWMARVADGKPVGVGSSQASLSPLQTSLSQNETQWNIAASRTIKILIKEEGWYRVSQPELVAAGLSSWVNPKNLQVFVEGQEQAIRVVGQDDSRFDSQDFIEFYATGLDTPSTDTRTYYLLEGETFGQRITLSEGIDEEPVSDSFPFSVTFKERVYYFPEIMNGETDNFFGPAIAPVSVLEPGFLDVIIGVSNLDPSPSLNATLQIAVQGLTVQFHSIKIFLNGTELRNVAFFGRNREVSNIEVLQSLLKEGENKITFFAEGGDTDIPDVSLVDYIQLTYWHTFTADDNVLKFQVGGGKHVTIEGFSRPEIRVVDYTDALNVREVIGVVTFLDPAYSITFQAPESGTRKLMAFTEDGVKTPLGIVADKPSSWHQQMPGYDFVIIYHRDFLKALKLLQKRRESQGLSVALVDVEDLYDEFNFGNKSPQAIRDFLVNTTRNWDKPPRFVLLVGDASFDPRNYFEIGDYDFVPTKIVETFYLETASDDWFVDVDEDGLPDMAVGRLPVRDHDEAAKVVTKILGYEKAHPMDHIVMVADFGYAEASREVEELLPSPIVVEEIFRENFGNNVEAKEALLASINEGPLLVNYLGDGSVEMWEGQILNSDDARFLSNRSQLPLFVNMTSLNGLFHDLYTESLAEALLKPAGGGAIAVWASSGQTEPEAQVVMNKEFVRLLFNGEGLTIGEAAARAKAATEDQDVRKTWILFGDPTTSLRY